MKLVLLLLVAVALAQRQRCPRGTRWVPCPPNARCSQAGFCRSNTPTSRPIGGDVDEHKCKRSAGYRWSFELGKCIRPWETQPPVRMGLVMPPPVRMGLVAPRRVGLPRPRRTRRPSVEDDEPIRMGLPQFPQDDEPPRRLGMPRRPRVDDEPPRRLGMPNLPPFNEEPPRRLGMPSRPQVDDDTAPRRRPVQAFGLPGFAG